MIDWDEILEDIDWKRGVATIILGLVIIGMAVFFGLDMHRANLLRAQLQNDQNDLQTFQSNWSGPGKGEVGDLEKELEAEKAELAATGVTLPESFDREAIESKIRQLAASDRVSITKITPADRSDEYAAVYEVEVTFSTSDPRGAATFLSDVAKMSEPHSVESQPVSIQGGTMKVTLDFYAFDVKAWDEINNCEVKLTMPNIPDREVTGIYIFGGDLKDLKSRVDQQKASLKDVKREFTEGCELQTQVDKVKAQIKIIKENIQK